VVTLRRRHRPIVSVTLRSHRNQRRLGRDPAKSAKARSAAC